jgi:hypothetical protein
VVLINIWAFSCLYMGHFVPALNGPCSCPPMGRDLGPNPARNNRPCRPGTKIFRVVPCLSRAFFPCFGSAHQTWPKCTPMGGRAYGTPIRQGAWTRGNPWSHPKHVRRTKFIYFNISFLLFISTTYRKSAAVVAPRDKARRPAAPRTRMRMHTYARSASACSRQGRR